MSELNLIAVDPGWRNAAYATLAVNSDGIHYQGSGRWARPRKLRHETRHQHDLRVVQDLSRCLIQANLGLNDFVVIEAFNHLRGKRAAYSMGLSWSPTVALAAHLGVPALVISAHEVRQNLGLQVAASKDECYGAALELMASQPGKAAQLSSHVRDAVAIGVAALELPAVAVTLRRGGLRV